MTSAEPQPEMPQPGTGMPDIRPGPNEEPDPVPGEAPPFQEPVPQVPPGGPGEGAPQPPLEDPPTL